MTDNNDWRDGARLGSVAGLDDPQVDADVVLACALYLGRCLEWCVNARRWDIIAELDHVCSSAFSQVRAHQAELAEEARNEDALKEKGKKRELLN